MLHVRKDGTIVHSYFLFIHLFILIYSYLFILIYLFLFILIYKSLIRSVIDYGDVVYSTANKSNLDKI